MDYEFYRNKIAGEQEEERSRHETPYTYCVRTVVHVERTRTIVVTGYCTTKKQKEDYYYNLFSTKSHIE